MSQTAELTERLGRTVLYEEVAISADGKQVAWVQTTAATSPKITFVAPAASGSKAKAVSLEMAGERFDSGLAWSPDSKTLALFSAPGERDQAQLWTVGSEGSGSKKRTHLAGYAARPRWSHDGTKIAFLHVEDGEGGGPLLAAPLGTGVIDTAIHNQRIFVLELATDTVRQASPANLHVYDFDWAPDDQTFVATAAPGPGDNNWWVAQIYRIDIGGDRATSVYKPSLQIAVPRWSPDGKRIAFIEGLMSDEGFHGGDLCTVALDGSGFSNHTRGHKGSVSSLFWRAPERIVLTETRGGGSCISELNPANNALHTLWEGGEDVHAFGNFPNFAPSADGKLAVLARSDLGHAPELWTGPIGKWEQVTKSNQAQTPEWGQVEHLTWTNEGLTIQGWLLSPRQVEQGRRYPLVVSVHGGPSSAAKPAWPSRFALSAILASQGYYVLMPNPRGSYGQGEDFTRANVKDLGGGDLRDILAGVDAVIAHYPVDPERIGVTGWSYGGFMTMWAVTQTKRFRAAMAGAGITNWQSYYGQNLIDQWMIPFFGASVYDDPASYEKSSPIRFIKQVTTPTLIIVGERDAECPAPQSYEFWHALKTLGVPTQLVVYAGEGHRFMKSANRVDMQDRTVAWFDRYLK